MSSLLAVYETCGAAETALLALRRTGFDLKQLSVLGGQHYENGNVIGYYTTGRGLRYWGAMRAFWDGLWSWLAGAGFFVVPRVGSILIAGPAAAWVGVALEGALVVSGLSVIGAGLYNRGIPRDFASRCEAALGTGKLVIVAHGSPGEILLARDALRASRPADLNVHLPETPVVSAA